MSPDIESYNSTLKIYNSTINQFFQTPVFIQTFKVFSQKDPLRHLTVF